MLDDLVAEAEKSLPELFKTAKNKADMFLAGYKKNVQCVLAQTTLGGLDAKLPSFRKLKLDSYWVATAVNVEGLGEGYWIMALDSDRKAKSLRVTKDGEYHPMVDDNLLFELVEKLTASGYTANTVH